MKYYFLIYIFFTSIILLSQENIRFSNTITSLDLYNHLKVLNFDSLEAEKQEKEDKNGKTI